MSKYASAQWFPDLWPIPPPVTAAAEQIAKALLWEFAPELIEAGVKGVKALALPFEYFKEKPFTTGAQAVYGAEADRVSEVLPMWPGYSPNPDPTIYRPNQMWLDRDLDYPNIPVQETLCQERIIETVPATIIATAATDEVTYTPPPVQDAGVIHDVSKEAPIMHGKEIMPFFGIDYDTPMRPPENIVAYSWVTNKYAPEDEQIRFFRLINGKIAVRRKNGVWKMWTPKKMIVVSNNPRLGQFNRASKKIITLSKKLDKNFKALNPPRRRAAK